MRSSRRLGYGVGVLVVLAVAAWGAFAVAESQRLQKTLDEAKRDLEAGRVSTASRLLQGLATRKPGWGDVEYHLGLCAQRQGRSQTALEAWSRVPQGSVFAARAASRRGRLLIDLGRFALAESILEEALPAAGADADDVRRELELLYQFEGRPSDVRRLILETWREARDPASVLKKLYIVETNIYPVDAVRTVLERADPEDDRVWLAKANLANRTGAYLEAASWLDRCEQRRPTDRAVWRGRLELALANNDAQTVYRAASHLPVAEVSPTEVLSLRAWLTRQSGDAEAERRSLEALLQKDSGNVIALERLADLAWKAGREDEVTRLRRRKAEVNDAREAYRRLLNRPDPLEHVPEFIRLAEVMGRPLEAKGWTLVGELSRQSGAQTARPPLIIDTIPTSQVGQTLSDFVSDLNPAPEIRKSISTVADRLGSLSFVDDAEAIGLSFLHDTGRSSGQTIPPTIMCGGVGLLDYDGDGRLDVYAVQGGSFPPPKERQPFGDRLFRNRGDGTFEDATARSGLAAMPGGYGHGVTVGDVDNDGRPDLFVTRWRRYALYRNKGDGTFEDATETAGLGGERDWPTSAAFADLDGDGDLDLYVCHYLKYDENDPRLCNRPGVSGAHDCNPRDFPSLPDHLFRNDGGRFVDVTHESGIVDLDGRGLGVVAAHLDDDDKIDLFVANDSTANLLFRNLGNFRFEESAHTAGVAANASGAYQAGMGVACGDLDGDRRSDLLVTNFYGESTTFFQNLGGSYFADRTAAVNLSIPSRHLLGFGILLFDANNDGRLDIMTANGHIHDGRPQYPWTMPVQLLMGGADGRLVDASKEAGPLFSALHLGRGLAVGDLDNDGRSDALLIAQNEPMVAFRNRSEAGRAVVVRLEGTASNRDAIGARVTVEVAGHRRMAQRIGGGSYQSSSDPRLLFGLGDAPGIDWVEVRWPSGRIERFAGFEAGAGRLLREGAGQSQPLQGWPR